jgi:hypothetical protein
MSDPRYPIGKFSYSGPMSPAEREAAIEKIELTPLELRKAVQGLANAQLETPYREGGWTVRQTVHHVADSHMNAYIRLRFALTEDAPTIKPYDEAQWAQLHDASAAPVGVSLALLDALHTRWSMLWRSLKEEDFARVFVHPEHGERTVDWLAAIYAWHGPHHVAHITELRKAKGWS